MLSEYEDKRLAQLRSRVEEAGATLAEIEHRLEEARRVEGEALAERNRTGFAKAQEARRLGLDFGTVSRSPAAQAFDRAEEKAREATRARASLEKRQKAQKRMLRQLERELAAYATPDTVGGQ